MNALDDLPEPQRHLIFRGERPAESRTRDVVGQGLVIGGNQAGHGSFTEVPEDLDPHVSTEE
jgi:hypothetical protein